MYVNSVKLLLTNFHPMIFPDSRTTSNRIAPSRGFVSSNTNLRSSKENLSNSSSSVSNRYNLWYFHIKMAQSRIVYFCSQQDLTRSNAIKPTTSTPNIMSTTTPARSSPMRITSTATLTPSSPSKARRQTPSSNLSFMKPTTSSAKKLTATNVTTNATGPRKTTATTTRLTATRPSRR